MWTPCAKSYLKKELKKLQEDFKQRQKSKRSNQVYKLPDKGMKEDTIMKRMENGSAVAKLYYTNGGKMSGGVYTANEEHWDFVSEVMRQHITSNPLHMVEFAHVS
jgi:hypothetical protein